MLLKTNIFDCSVGVININYILPSAEGPRTVRATVAVGPGAARQGAWTHAREGHRGRHRRGARGEGGVMKRHQRWIIQIYKENTNQRKIPKQSSTVDLPYIFIFCTKLFKLSQADHLGSKVSQKKVKTTS